MKSGLTIGHAGELVWIVDPTMTITLADIPQATVFSTPSMIMLMERAAREALRPYLEPGEESVGVAVQVEHSSAAVLGTTVRGVARVTKIEGRRVDFEISTYAGERLLGQGTHRRAMVQVERVVENILKISGETEPAMNLKRNTGELMELQTIQMQVTRKVAVVTLNRPRSLNAVTVQMTGELEQLVAWLAGHQEEVRVVILTGSGDAFCAGDDVKELAQMSPDAARMLSLRQANIFLAFERLPQTVIAAVSGVAFGAGCVAAYSCDLRLASHAARFGMPEITLGWPPGYGIAQLSALVGKARAMELCLLGESISATQALEWGLINELVPGQILMQRAQQIADRLLQMPAEALRETKRLVHADEGSLPKVTHRADTAAYIRCLELADAREGIAAFAEKRPPRFTGK